MIGLPSTGSITRDDAGSFFVGAVRDAVWEPEALLTICVGSTDQLPSFIQVQHERIFARLHDDDSRAAEWLISQVQGQLAQGHFGKEIEFDYLATIVWALQSGRDRSIPGI